MILFSHRYVVNFRNGRKKLKTALEILKLVEKDCKSDYNWFASSDELVRLCKLPGFPQDVATFIEAAVLNCYANIEYSVLEYPDSRENVTFCYDSLIEREQYIDLRKKYICSVLNSVIAYGLNDEPRIFPLGETYNNMCCKWRESVMNDFVSNKRKIIDLSELYKIFNDEFEGMIDEAEAKHLFEDDEKKFFQNDSWTKILKNYDYYPDPDQIR